MLQELQIKETKNENKAVVEKKTITKKMKLKSKASFPLRKSARLAKRSSADNLDMKRRQGPGPAQTPPSDLSGRTPSLECGSK